MDQEDPETCAIRLAQVSGLVHKCEFREVRCHMSSTELPRGMLWRIAPQKARD